MTADSDPRITITDMRPLYCVKGVKKGFDAAGLNFGDFLRHGALASELKGHGYDAVIDRVVEAMREKAATHG